MAIFGAVTVASTTGDPEYVNVHLMRVGLAAGFATQLVNVNDPLPESFVTVPLVQRELQVLPTATLPVAKGSRPSVTP